MYLGFVAEMGAKDRSWYAKPSHPYTQAAAVRGADSGPGTPEGAHHSGRGYPQHHQPAKGLPVCCQMQKVQTGMSGEKTGDQGDRARPLCSLPPVLAKFPFLINAPAPAVAGAGALCVWDY